MSAEIPGVEWIAASQLRGRQLALPPVQAILVESFSVNDAQTHG